MTARADTIAVYKRHTNVDSPSRNPHPLDGKTVAEWVAEARAGWPKVPVPGDPAKAAQKLADKYGDELELDVPMHDTLRTLLELK